MCLVYKGPDIVSTEPEAICGCHVVVEDLFVGSASDSVKTAVELIAHTISSVAFVADKGPVRAESVQEVSEHDIDSIQFF